jgi:hypothetical protein
VTLFRRMVRRAPRVEPWPDMPPRPQRMQQPLREDPPQLHRPSPPLPFQAAMSGGIDHPECDPCGAPPIAVRKNGEK